MLSALLVGPLAGCDPVVEVEGDSAAAGTSTTGNAEGSADSGSDGGTGSTSWMDEPEADATTDANSNDDDYGESECGCDPLVPVTLDEVVAEDWSAATVLSMIRRASVGFSWVELSGDLKPTVLEIDLAYEGDQIMHGPDGFDGCNFLSSPCHNTLSIPVVAQVSTTDGVLTARLPATVELDLDRKLPMVVLRGALAFSDAEGTIPEYIESEYETLAVFLEWTLDGSWTEATVSGIGDRDHTLLGHAQ